MRWLLLALLVTRCRCGLGSVLFVCLWSKLLVQGHPYLEAEVVWAVRWVVFNSSFNVAVRLAYSGSCCISVETCSVVLNHVLAKLLVCNIFQSAGAGAPLLRGRGRVGSEVGAIAVRLAYSGSCCLATETWGDVRFASCALVVGATCDQMQMLYRRLAASQQLSKLLVQGHPYLEAEVVWAVRWVLLLYGWHTRVVLFCY
jgi:hypothetical protein